MVNNNLFENEDASLRMTSNMYIYIIWMLIAIVVVILTMVIARGIGGKYTTGISYAIIAIGTFFFLKYSYKILSAINVYK
jgi:hypothetical protein